MDNISKYKKIRRNSLTDENVPLSSSLGELKAISIRLRLSGLATVVLTLISLIITLILGAGRGLFFNGLSSIQEVRVDINVALFFAIFTTLSTVLILIFHESLKRQGNAIFEEISDELQWNIKNKHVESDNIKSTIADSRPELEHRIALRVYSRSGDLPLIPGQYGSAVFAGVNIFLLFLSVVFYNTLLEYLR